VTLCPECIAAERAGDHIGVTVHGRLCCIARSIAVSLRKDLTAEFANATAGMPPEDVEAVRARARAIWAALQEREAQA
jgi:antitoxin (DNA-binding transcriptional repressor) of toxin-antitoxin stability system